MTQTETAGETEVMQSVARLLEAQRWLASSTCYAATHSIPPLMGRISAQRKEASIAGWSNLKKELRLSGWNDEQRLYQLKAHLEKNVQHT